MHLGNSKQVLIALGFHYLCPRIMENNRKTDALRQLLSGAPKNAVIVSHTNPDGDSVGSSLALARVLASMGHQVTCIVPNRIPSFLSWMKDANKIHVLKLDPEGTLPAVESAEVIFCVDFNQISRLEGLSDAILANTGAKRILIDHHPDAPLDQYDIAFSDPSACSTAYLLFTLIEQAWGVESIDRYSAETLYAGIMTDTGNFSFSNLSPDMFRAVAALVERGVHPPTVFNAVYNSFSESRMRLMGYVLSRKMEVMRPYRTAFLSLTEEEMRRFHFQVGDSEGFVNLPLSISKMKMSAMFMATTHFIRVSLRSRGDVDVNAFAKKYFNGGGHRNASGGKSFMTMEQTIDHFKKAVAEFFGEK